MPEIAPREIKLLFADGETGHGYRIAEDLAELQNIPFEGPWNLWDIVKVEHLEGNLFKPVALVTRKYPRKSVLYYAQDGDFHRLCAVLRLVGCEPEGGLGAEDGRPGMMAVAHPDHVDAVGLAACVGSGHDKSREVPLGQP